MSPGPRCSIIIPLFNRADLTAACLEALRANTHPDSYELIIVDNASSDETEALCQSLGDDVAVIRNERNLGFAVACNQGATAATTDHLLFLNNDTEPEPGWLPPLIQAIEAEPNIAAVGAKLLFADRSVQHAGVVMVLGDTYPHLRAMHVPYQVSEHDPLAAAPRDVLVVTGACLLVRRECFLEVGGFDEAYWNGYEDVDLCLKLGGAGWRIRYEPRSVVIHHESASGPERFSATDQNVALLQERWTRRICPDFVVDGGTTRIHPDGLFARSGAVVVG